MDHFAGGSGPNRSVHRDVLGIMMVCAFSPEKQRSGVHTAVRPKDEPELLRRAIRAMEYSAAAYGWSGMNQIAAKFGLQFNDASSTSLGSSVADQEAAGIMGILQNTPTGQPEDILYSNFSSSDATGGRLPNHYIAFDHGARAIVVAFRGTFSLTEALTDVNCLPVPFTFQGRKGSAHEAMLAGATMADVALSSAIHLTATCFPDYEVWIVGHSLGGGIAALYTCLLKDKFPDMNLKAYTFGTPGVLSLNLANLCEEIGPDFMNAFSMGDDNVPRLSRGSIYDLVSMSERLWVHFNGRIDAIVSLGVFCGRVIREEGLVMFVVNVVILSVIAVVLLLFGYIAKYMDKLGKVLPAVRAARQAMRKKLRPEAKQVNPLFRQQSIENMKKAELKKLRGIHRANGGAGTPRMLSPFKKITLAKQAADSMLSAATNKKLYPPGHIYHIRIKADKAVFMMEKSAPEHFGWLLLSPHFALHHMPRTYLESIKKVISYRESRRKLAKERWLKAKRTNRMATMLQSFGPGQYIGDHAGVFAALARYESVRKQFTDWVHDIKFVGAHTVDPSHTEFTGKRPTKAPEELLQEYRDIKSTFSAKKTWKRAGTKVKMAGRVANGAFQKLGAAKAEQLHTAFSDITAKQKEVSTIVDALKEGNFADNHESAATSPSTSGRAA